MENKNKSERSKNKLLMAASLTGLFMIAEVVGGVISGSLALISDAGHMFTDFIALAMAYIAAIISKKGADHKRTYGYGRFPILVAFGNAIFMFCIVGWILFTAIERIFAPQPVLPIPMLVIGSLGLIVNIIAFKILHSDDENGCKGDLNVQSAAVHVLGDMLGSIAAIIAAIVIYYTEWFVIDPVLSLFVALIISYHAWGVVKKSSHILIEGSPEICMSDIENELMKLEKVKKASHVHVWHRDDSELLATLHIDTECCTDYKNVKIAVRKVLKDKFGITHSTIEFGD